MAQAAPSKRNPVMWLVIGTLIGVGACVACAMMYFIFQEINASVREAALDEQCVFADIGHTDAQCDVWVEEVTTVHRGAFIQCAGRGTAEDTYACLVEKGLGP